jgi:hypothetical protein
LAPKALVEAKAVSPPAIRKPRRLRIRDIKPPWQFEVAWIVTDLSGVPGSQTGIREVPGRRSTCTIGKSSCGQMLT